MTSNPAETSAEPARAEPIAIVAGHGDFASGMISAVDQITGRGELLLALTNREFGASELEGALRAAAGSAPVRVIFTDLPAGSCALAARRLLRERPDLVLVTGANLATIIDFVCAGAHAGREAVLASVERGRSALVAVAPSPPAPPADALPAPTPPTAPAAPAVSHAAPEAHGAH